MALAAARVRTERGRSFTLRDGPAELILDDGVFSLKLGCRQWKALSEQEIVALHGVFDGLGTLMNLVPQGGKS